MEWPRINKRFFIMTILINFGRNSIAASKALNRPAFISHSLCTSSSTTLGTRSSPSATQVTKKSSNKRENPHRCNSDTFIFTNNVNPFTGHDTVITKSASQTIRRKDLMRRFVTTTTSDINANKEANDNSNDNDKQFQSENKNKISTQKSHHRSKVEPSPPPSPDDASVFPPWSFQPRDFFKYELVYQSKKSMARVGRIHTPHGIIDTPGYVAVATNGALKGLDMRDADAAGQQLVFCNSYHLLLQPGPEVIEAAGGLHKFMNRPNGPLITDSGGFQVFSLAYGSVKESLDTQGELKRANVKNNKDGNSNEPPVKVTENGVVFKSYRDGRKILLTPESTVQAQKSYGADIIIPLDQLPPYHIDKKLLKDSVDRSHRWEARSLIEHLKDVRLQAMYCVVHGGVDVDLRTKSVEYLTSLPFDGYAIGGSLGKNADELLNLLAWMMPMFDEGKRREKPRHLLGIADEKSILGAVKKGIDTFDSCYPTRLSRHGTLLTRKGKIHIRSGIHSKSIGMPIDPECNCSTCQHYDRTYLWHLYKANEPLYMQLAAVHNIQYMNDLMAQHRQDILDGKI